MVKPKKNKAKSIISGSTQPEIKSVEILPQAENNQNSTDSEYYPVPSQSYQLCYQQIGTKAYELLRNRDGPVLVATVAVELSLALLRRGAEGVTEDALGMALDMRNARDIVLDNYQAYMAGKEDICTSCECRSVNLLLLDEAYTLESEFARSAANGFLVKCLTLPLYRDPEVCSAIANEHVRVLTRNTVIGPIQTEDLTNNPGPIALVNALYFKGRWKYPFRKEKSLKGRFTSITNKSQTRAVDMMFCKGHFGYLALPQIGAKILILPFADDEFVLVLALPSNTAGMEQLEQRLLSIRLTDVLSHASHPEVSVWLPRFTLEGVNDIGNELGNIGLAQLKDPDKVHLPFMCRKRGLFLGAFVQKVVIDITSENCDYPAYPRAPETVCSSASKTFKADRPFVLFVMNQYTGCILCAGRYE